MKLATFFLGCVLSTRASICPDQHDLHVELDQFQSSLLKTMFRYTFRLNGIRSLSLQLYLGHSRAQQHTTSWIKTL